jgi:hypothetical protein
MYGVIIISANTIAIIIVLVTVVMVPSLYLRRTDHRLVILYLMMQENQKHRHITRAMDIEEYII